MKPFVLIAGFVTHTAFTTVMVLVNATWAKTSSEWSRIGFGLNVLLLIITLIPFGVLLAQFNIPQAHLSATVTYAWVSGLAVSTVITGLTYFRGG